MALHLGDQVAQYVVEDLLGSGGMGEVYLARDSELGRKVAIKVVRDDVVQSASIRERLRREGRVLANLNHPNIATLYGIEQLSDQCFLVMELVDGGSLANQLQRGPLPVRQTLAVFAQVADALASAHSAGVVHRDLKPDNICLSEDGDVKVLDFGLATHSVGADGSSSHGEASRASTLTRLTQAGQVMGTAGYVSPEVATGQQADWRSDVWSFGCCLYESLAGKRPFEGSSIQESIAAAVTSEPSWAALPQGLDPKLVTLVRRCLEKDPQRRIQSLADARVQLLELESPPTSMAPQEVRTASSKPPLRSRIAFGTIVVGLLTASGYLVGTLTSVADNQTQSPVHLSLQVPGNLPLRTASDSPNVQVSRRGDQLFLLAGRGSQRQIYRRALAKEGLVPVPGTSGAADLAFSPSPDGEEVVFVRDGRFLRTSTEGGIATEISRIKVFDPDFFSCFWADDGSIYFTSGTGRDWTIHRVSKDGGVPEKVTELNSERGEIGHTDPFVVPESRVLLYSAKRESAQNSEIWMRSLLSGETTLLVEDGHHPVVTSRGHLMFSRGSTVFAAAFDIKSGALGHEVPVVAGVESAGLARAALFSISRTGTLVYVKEGQTYNRRLAWLARDGEATLLNVEADRYHTVRLSRDGSWATLGRVAVDEDVREDLVLVALERVGREILLSDGYINNYPVFSPDGREVAFTSNRDGQWNLYALSVSGDRAPRCRFPQRCSVPASSRAASRSVLSALGGDCRSAERDRVGRLDPATR